MKAQEIYHQIKSIIEPIHAHNDQMVAIAKWIESEFDYAPSGRRKYSFNEIVNAGLCIIESDGNLLNEDMLIKKLSK